MKKSDLKGEVLQEDDRQKLLKLELDNAEILKKRAEAINIFLSILYKVGAGVGALATFAYLFLINFFPSGMTPGEALFFVFIALAFAFTYFVFVLYGAISSLWIANLIHCIAWIIQFDLSSFEREIFPCNDLPDRVTAKLDVKICSRLGGWQHSITSTQKFKCLEQWWRNKRFGATRAALEKRRLAPSYTGGWIYSLTSIFLFILFAITAYELNNPQLTQLFGASFTSGFIALVFLALDGEPHNSKQKTWIRVFGIGVVPVLLICMFAGPRPILNLAFQGLGIRMQNVSIEIPDSEMGSIDRISDLIKRPLIDCRRPQPNKIFVHDAEILWTGIGDQTLVIFSAQNPESKKLFAPEAEKISKGWIKFDTKSIRIVKTEPHIDPCFDLPSDLLFDTGKYALTEEADARLKQVTSTIVNLGKPIKILVRGHSDPRKIYYLNDGVKVDNQVLSERRAVAVASALKKQINDPKLQIVSEGAGSRENRIKCLNSGDFSNYEQDQCNKPNRRVEVRVEYAH